MIFSHVDDFDDAYDNAARTPDVARFPQAWVTPAATFRADLARGGRLEADLAYDEGPRCTLDLFLPEAPAQGLVVFVHGGYWHSLDKSYWSHFAAGPLARGFAVAMPSYPLCPDATIARITRAVGAAIAVAAERVAGPIGLAGHSAGGHLVARMITTTSPLPAQVRERVAMTVSIAGVHDLRPLLATRLNATFRLDEAEACAESPVLLRPLPGARLVAWVGGADRAEFLRQNDLLANVWTGLGARTSAVREPDRHHFDVIDALTSPDHPITRLLTGADG